MILDKNVTWVDDLETNQEFIPDEPNAFDEVEIISSEYEQEPHEDDWDENISSRNSN